MKVESTQGQYSGNLGVSARMVILGTPYLTSGLVNANEGLPMRLEGSGELGLF